MCYIHLASAQPLTCEAAGFRAFNMTRLLSLIVVASAIVGGISSSSPNDGYRYRTSQTAPFLIEHLPEIDFDIGELYGGSVGQPEDPQI